MSWDVRATSTREEFAGALGSIGHFFGGWPKDDQIDRFNRILPFERTHAAFDGGGIVGGAGALPLELTVPGGPVACAGVTVVGVLPTHRRRGVLTALMRAQLDDVRRRGEPLAALWASEEGIYGRFGYGLASLAAEMELPRTYAELRVPPDPSARTRLVTLEEARELVPPVYDRVRRATPGMLSRSDAWWELRHLSDPPERRGSDGEKSVVLLELDGRIAGYALYRLNLKFEGGSSIGQAVVLEALADSPVAGQELWRYLLGLDWMATVKATLLPVDHPLLHLLANPRRMRLRLGDALWIRLVDVGAALSARSYAPGDPVVLDVADAFLPENAGRWRLVDGRAERTESAADLALDVTGLAGPYLGGFTFAELVRAGVVRELGEGAAARADRLFASAIKPWCPEIF